MAIRIRPKKIEIPKEDPFKYDLLERKESAEVLTHLVGSIEGSCVLAIDAAWGNGKTTFLELWSRHLRNNHFPVVELNAWKTDYVENPFTALSIELTDGLKQHADEDVIDSVKEGAVEVLRQFTPGILRLISNSIPGGGSLGPDIGDIIAKFAEYRFTTYEETRDSVQGFKENLQAMAKKVSEDHENKPVLIMVDELDRCRPSYAVELLEVAKHLFSADHIIFVLAINRAELGHSVKALYGQDFDANGYLKRFIDIDFILPSPNRDKFISNLVEQTKIGEYFQRTQDSEARSGGLQFVETLLKGILGTSTVSLRQISQAVHRIGLVLASLPNRKKAFSLTIIVALIVRTIDENLYHRFRIGKATDLEVVETIFPGKESSIQLTELPRRQFEFTIMLGYEELSGQQPHLLQYYQDVQSSEEPGSDALRVYRSHAEQVLHQCELVRQADGSRGAEFRFVIPRIELFSSELNENQVSNADAPA